MEKTARIEKTEHISEQSQVFYIDGCKVTVRYSGRSNPAAIKNIKNTLLSSNAEKKD